jgi:proteasome lid subunit RPN8/RPN11
VSVPAPHPLLTPEALAEMYAHARRDYPNECCGIVFGPRDDRAASRALPCVNIQNELHAEDPSKHARDARTAYNLGAGDLFRLQKSLRGAEPAKVVYHSHVDVGAYFSETDRRNALVDGQPAYPDTTYIVVGVSGGRAGEARAFRWDPAARDFLETPLTLEEAR